MQDQPQEFSCTDQAEPSTIEPFDAQIACVDDQGSELVNRPVSPGNMILVQGPRNGTLGSMIMCEISEISPDTGELTRLQEMSITTAVLGNFYLQDRYGSLVVESCDAQRCNERVIYTYTITNVNDDAQTISGVERERLDDRASLLSLIPQDQLTQEPGGRIVVTEEASINLCFDADIETVITVEADPSSGGGLCQGRDDYNVLVEVECRVAIDILCESDTGVECGALALPEGSCSENGDGLRALRFRYDAQSCEEEAPTNSQGDASTCRDFTMPFGRVQIICTGGNSTDPPVQVTIESGDSDVGAGETVLLTSNGGFLPDVVSCEIRSSLDTDVIYQAVSFDASGSIELNLQDRFGSLEVEACSTDTTRLDCLTTVCVEYVIQNVGTNDATVIELTRALQGSEAENIFSFLAITELARGERTEAIEKIVVDTCTGEEYCISATVQAQAENELIFEDNDEYCFGQDGPCEVGLNLTCETTEGDIVDCTSVQAEQSPQCVCSGCPTDIIFRYTGDACPDVAVPGLIACLDELPTPANGASIVISTGESELFSGFVDVGEEIQVTQESCIPAEIMVMIRDVANGAATSSQVVTIDTSCTGPGISLLQNFGAVQFSGYTCSDESPHNCFIDAQFEIVASNTGAVSQTLATFDFVLNGATSNLLDGLSDDDLELLPSESVSITRPFVLERCIETQYLATSSVSGNDGECTANAELLIGPFQPGTPAPSAATPEPTAAPVTPVTPTVAPSIATPEPTEAPLAPVTPTVAPSIATPEPTEAPVATVTPTFAPSIATPEPTEAPVAPVTPTVAPSIATPEPTEAPVAPVTPTVAPSIATSEPTATPVAPVTPTVAPSIVTPEPTIAPVTPVTPTAVPSAATPAPTSDVPTVECIFEIQTECTPPEGSESCEQVRSDPALCEGQPTQLQFMYNGGNCDNSFNAQSEPLFICEDYKGGPPTEEGASSFVVVTDIRGAGIVYFAEWVSVGEIISFADGNVLEPNQNITIYDSNITGPDSIVQTTVFHASCTDTATSQSLFLKDRFGSMQLVGFVNEAQGELSCFVNTTFDISITVPNGVVRQPLTISSVVTQFSGVPGGPDGTLNSTADFVDEQISTGDAPVSFDLGLDLDLTVRRTYSVFTTVRGVATNGQQCEGTDLYQFAAGQPPPPLFPTIAPTVAPTISAQPSPDPETTPCSLRALLTCNVINGGSNTCTGLQNPSDVTCTGDLSPSSLTFQYTGDRCPVNLQNYECTDTEANLGAAREEVFVEITEGVRIIYFGVVRLNQVFVADGDFGDSTTITLYTVINGMRGEELQRLVIPTSCNPDDDLTLLNQYGALELTGFTNAASGQQSIEANIELVYAVENAGFQSANVESALIIDAFDGGPIEIVDSPFELQSDGQSVLFRNVQLLNLRLKEQLGRVDTFFLSITGTSVSNDIACTSTAQLSF